MCLCKSHVSQLFPHWSKSTPVYVLGFRSFIMMDSRQLRKLIVTFCSFSSSRYHFSVWKGNELSSGQHCFSSHVSGEKSHFKMKRPALFCRNMLSHRILHHWRFTRYINPLYITAPIKHCYTCWFVGPLGCIAFNRKQTAPEFLCNQQISSFFIISVTLLLWLLWHLIFSSG